MVTIPAREYDESNGATNQAKGLLFSNLENLLAFTNQAGNQAGKPIHEILEAEIRDKVKAMLILASKWCKRKEILEKIGVTNQTYNKRKFLEPLVTRGWLKMRHQVNDSHPEQAYKITESGKILLKLLIED